MPRSLDCPLWWTRSLCPPTRLGRQAGAAGHRGTRWPWRPGRSSRRAWQTPSMTLDADAPIETTWRPGYPVRRAPDPGAAAPRGHRPHDPLDPVGHLAGDAQRMTAPSRCSSSPRPTPSGHVPGARALSVPSRCCRGCSVLPTTQPRWSRPRGRSANSCGVPGAAIRPDGPGARIDDPGDLRTEGDGNRRRRAPIGASCSGSARMRPVPRACDSPPTAERLATLAYHQLHPAGLEQRRAVTILRAASRAAWLEAAGALTPTRGTGPVAGHPGCRPVDRGRDRACRVR